MCYCLAPYESLLYSRNTRKIKLKYTQKRLNEDLEPKKMASDSDAELPER